VIEVQKGELPASRRYLEKRWSWGSTKVANFLKTLEKLDMVNQRQANGQTIIRLCKYCDFQETQTTNKPPTEPTTNHGQTTDKPKEKNIRTKDLKERKEEFREKVFSHSHIDSENLERFFKYWSEHSERGRKMFWEKKPTFNIKSRLDTWMRNNREWKKPEEKGGFQKNRS
jgi:hypothetical protein